MAKWAGLEEDWIQQWRAGPLRKAEVIPALVKTIHASPLQGKKVDGGIPLRKERDLDNLIIEPPGTVEGIELVIRQDSGQLDQREGKAEDVVWHY